MTARAILDLWHRGVPRAKERPRLGRRNRDGTVAVYTPESTRNEEDVIGWEWVSKNGLTMLTDDVELTIVAVGGAADLDNHLKLIGDALNGVAYVDDRQIVHIRAWKLPAGCGAERGTYIRLRPMSKHWRRRVIDWLARM
jgi:crossover junction endodeoxyribonuclease RusA